jgi:iron complex transport system ATP-binding protein
MEEQMFSLKNVTFSYGSEPLFSGLTLTVNRGDVVFVLGENGSGKSTLLKIICGILTPSSGNVSVNGREISSFGKRELASLVSYGGDEVPADFPLTVYDFVSLGRFPHRGFFGTFSSGDREMVEKAMEMMEIAPFRDRYLHELSAGERQRTFLARTVAQDGELMVLDEPAAHLDMRTRVKIFGMLEHLATGGKTVFVSSHDANLSARYSKSVLILKAGGLIAYGPTEHVITEEKIREAFGVEVQVDVNPSDGTPRITIIE